ncbi:MAG: Fur family transcriptional regulator [bacterium]
MPAAAAPAFRTSRHNHDHCIAAAMARAEARCRREGVRFTRIRRRVLELIWASHRPASAYDLLQQLRREKRNAEPPTVYRALDFLLANRLAHRIESLNAYVGCARPQHPHVGQFLICSDCNQVAELDDAALQRKIASTASRAGLEAARQTVEIIGRCARCR